LADGTKADEVAAVGEIPGRVFTTDEIEEVRKDLKRMVKPSWVTSVPTSLSSSGPKLKSDQWRTVGSLYLPVTLIRLWTNGSTNPSPNAIRRQKLLHMTMLLFSAINVATSRVTSRRNAKVYLDFLIQYRQELHTLFPRYQCAANQHLAFHISTCLLLHGPVQGWWAFPFERVIGMLQRFSTNYKAGKSSCCMLALQIW
jgi:hypothetical protein